MARRFSNLDGTADVADLVDLLRWQLGFHDEKRPRAPATGVAVPVVANDGRMIRQATKDALTWIGHASFLIQLGGKSALIDPVMSERLTAVLRRNVAPGLDWPALPKIDVVLVTHNHRDHMDAPTLKRLGRDPVYVVPRGLGGWFDRAGFPRIIEMDWWQEEEIEGLNVTFVPSQHWSRRGLTDMNESWWGGYVIERGGLRVYHSGDTAWFDGFSLIADRCGEIQAAMLPIGAYAPRWFMRTQHMDPKDAIRAFEALGADKFVAMHWGTFKLTDEHLAEPPELLRDLWERRGLHDHQRLVPAIGETLLLDR
jgi:L-ascorbate metabolism protein UlaG (beta-lactamase superfamily)